MPMIVFIQLQASPMPKRRRCGADIDGHIKNGAAYHTHQLTLWLGHLVMQTPKHALRRPTVVVLYEGEIGTGRGIEVTLIEAFKKESARIAEYTGLEDQDIGDRSSNYVHGAMLQNELLVKPELQN